MAAILAILMASCPGTLDMRSYRKSIKVSKAHMKCLDIVGDQPRRCHKVRRKAAS
jgi:hypothetical protein